MELKEGLEIFKKMCAQAPENCEGCPLDVTCPFGLLPHEWSDNDPERVVAAAEEWKKKRKPKTMLEVLKERLPNVQLTDNGRPSICPSFFFGDVTLNLCRIDERLRCNDCWNRPAPDEFQDKE